MKRIISGKKKLSTKLVILGLSVFGFFLYFGISQLRQLPFFAKEGTHSSPKKVVEITQLTPTSIERTVRLIGMVRAKNATRLLAQASGIFQKEVEAGTFVKKGTLLARIVNDPIEKQFDVAQRSESLASIQYNRIASLYARGAVSKKERDAQQTVWLDAQNRLAISKIALDKIRFYAPFDGIVGTFLERDRSEINETAPVVTFYDPTNLVVAFDIPALLLGKLPLQPTVHIENKKYTLLNVQKVVDENTHMSPAEVAVDSSQTIIGLPTDVDLCVERKENVLVLPDEAIFMQDRKNFVYVIKDGKAILTPIETGIRFRGTVEILKGLTPGQDVVKREPNRLTPSCDVDIFKPQNKVNDQTAKLNEQAAADKTGRPSTQEAH